MALMLEASRLIKAELTSLNEFILPCAAALWNLRYQVRGYIDEVPSLTEAQLTARFLPGSGINAANLRRFSKEQNWQDQQEFLARVVLTSQITLYESWQDMLPGLKKEDREKVQHTSSSTGRWNHRSATWDKGKEGWPDYLRSVVRDHDLERIFPPEGRSDEAIRVNEIDQLLLAYRVFKEARNSIVHGDSGSAHGERAYSEFSSLPPLLVSRNKRKPPLSVPPIEQGKPVRVDLSMITGLMSVLFRIVVTTDAILGVSEKIGPETFEARCRAQWPQGYRVRGSGKLEKKATLAMTSIRYPPPVEPGALASFMESRGLFDKP